MNLLFLAIGLLGLSVIGLGIMSGILMKKINQLTRGKNGANLESTIKENNSMMLNIQKEIAATNNQIDRIKTDAMNNIQNVSVVRFNPFKEAGGNQSFAIALTDKKKSGVVISSLYARERMNVFAKPITKGVSEYKLTEEEQLAINQSHE